jgi:hypothetical protein
MKKLLFIIAAAGVVMPAGPAIAHPTGIPYPTRGVCEVAFEQANKDDRDMLVALGIFDTIGAAQSTFKDLFECQYDPEQNAWFIVYIGPPGGPG